MQRPMDDPRIRWLMLGLAATLVLGVLIKWPCLHHPWDGTQYAFVCYSDIAGLYYVRGVADGVVPYFDGISEYPVLTGLWTFVAGWLSDDLAGYFWWNVAALTLAALGVGAALAWGGARGRLWMWALAPSLALSAYLNFDLFAVLFATVGIVAFRRGHVRASAVALGLGAAAKLYPGFLVPLFAVALWRRDGLGAGVRYGAFAAGAWAVVNLPVALLAPDGWWATYTFHAGRSQEWETLWMVAAFIAERRGWTGLQELVSPDVMGPVSMLALGLAIVFGALGVYRGRWRPEAASLFVLVVFFLTNPVFNAQYVLWVLPLFVLVEVPVPWVVGVFLADIGVHLTKFHLLMHVGTAAYDDHFLVFAAFVLVRFAALALMAAWVARPVAADLLAARRRTVDPEGA